MSGTFQPLIPFLALGFESTEERERVKKREREREFFDFEARLFY